jgi:cytochrome c biogenesis protein CcmG/thiol:disulfide interchange protein DsbE
MSEVLETGAAPEPEPPGPAVEVPGGRRRTAPFIALGVAAVVGLLIVVAAVAKGGDKETAATPLLGEPAPVVHTQAIDGQAFDLGSRRGSWVVLNFFSTWCRPCVEEHSDLVRFAQAQAAKPDGAELVSVIFNDDVDAVRAFFDENGGDWPKLTDPDGSIQVSFGVAKSPETWIIDPSGVVRGRIISRVTADQLSTLIDRLRAGEPAAG